MCPNFKGLISAPSMAYLNLPHFATMDELDPLLRDIMYHCCVRRNRRLLTEYLVWWHRLPLDDAMWEDTFEAHHCFPNF